MVRLTRFQLLMQRDDSGVIEVIALPFRAIGYIVRWPWWPTLGGHLCERFSSGGQLAFQLLCVSGLVCELVLFVYGAMIPLYTGTYRIAHADSLALFAAGFGILTAMRFIVWVVKYEK